MKCYFCREEVPEGAKFCPNCGAVVGEEKTDDLYTEESSDSEFDLKPSDVFDEIGNEDTPETTENDSQGMDFSYGQWSQASSEPESSSNEYTYGVPEYKVPEGNGQGRYQYQNSEANQNPYGNNGQQRISATGYIILSIASILLCCLPLGIVALVFAIRINTLQNAGDYEGARKSAKASRNSMIIGAVLTIIAMVAAVALTATSSEFKDTLNEIMEETDTSDTTDIFNADDVKDETENSDDVEKQNIGDSWTSGTIQIRDAVVTVPCTFEEIQAAGLKLDDYSVEETTEISAHDYELAYFSDENNNQICAILFNNTDGTIQTKDATVGGIQVLSLSADDIYLPGNISLESTFDDLNAAYGEPDFSDESEDTDYCEYDWYGGDEDEYFVYLSVQIEKSTSKISQIYLVNMPGFEWEY